jgi:hypothetical protein
MGFRGGVDVSGREKYVAAVGKGNTDRPWCSVVVIPTAGIAMVNKCV